VGQSVPALFTLVLKELFDKTDPKYQCTQDDIHQAAADAIDCLGLHGESS